MLGNRRKVRQNVAEVALAKRRLIPGRAARYHGEVNPQLLGGPWTQRVVQIGGGVGKMGEDQYLAIRLAALVRGRVVDLFGDECLEFGELRVALGGNVFGKKIRQFELLAVALQIRQPLLAIEMRHVEDQLFSHLHRCLQLFISEMFNCAVFQIQIGVFRTERLKSSDAFF